MLKVSINKKYILRPLTKTMKNKIRNLKNLHKSDSSYVYSRLDLKIKTNILMSVVKKYKHGYVVYFYNYELGVGEFKFLPNVDVNFIVKDSTIKNIKSNVYQWRDYREYKDYLENYTPIEKQYEENNKKIRSLKIELNKHISMNNDLIRELEMENSKIESILN